MAGLASHVTQVLELWRKGEEVVEVSSLRGG